MNVFGATGSTKSRPNGSRNDLEPMALPVGKKPDGFTAEPTGTAQSFLQREGMMITIKHRFTETTLCEFDVETVKEAVVKSVSSGANLCGADLRDADLCGADLRGANLYGADLYGANLYGTDLRGADLCGANLRGADLYGANLYSADLRDADLCGANLCGANMDGEKLTQTPLTVTGLTYWCLISDNYMRLGCKRFTHSEWGAFSDSEIAKMDSKALEFWSAWKSPLLAMCKAHSEKNKYYGETNELRDKPAQRAAEWPDAAASNPDCAAQLDPQARDHGWLYIKGADGQWVTHRKLADAEIEEANDQAADMVVKHGTKVRAG